MSPRRPGRPTDLQRALSPLRSGDLAKQIVDELEQRAEEDLRKLEDIPESDLQLEDAAHRARLVYVGSYRRLWEFLKEKAGTFNHRHQQARIALNYVQHIEKTDHKALHLGRAKGDAALEKGIASMQRELEKLAEIKAGRKEPDAESGAALLSKDTAPEA